MRNCECICTPPMFQSRVSGVGIIVPTAEEIRKESERMARIGPAMQEYQRKAEAWGMGLAEARRKCPPIDPNIRYIQAPICQPAVDYIRDNPRPVMPEDTSPAPAPTKPTGSALPLLLGAAYLLLA